MRDAPVSAQPASSQTPGKPLVAVLAGGFSAEYEVSLQSGRAVFESLLGGPYEPVLLRLEAGGWTLEDGAPGYSLDSANLSLFSGEIRKRFDAAFVAVHGNPGESGELAGYLRMLGIPHSTCDVRAAVITFDKALCKTLVQGCGVRLAHSVLLTRQNGAEHPGLQALRYPVFVKPSRNGSSCGISKVKHPDALGEALAQALGYDDEILVEESVEGGTEVTCAVYRRGDALHTLPLCEVVSGAGHEFFDYKAKYTAGEADEIIPARIPVAMTEQVRSCSMAVYEALGLQGLVRIDYILRDGACWFLEVNTVPGMSGASIVPRMLRAAGLDPGSFYAELLDEALRQQVRHHGE
jgi:D-alanine-D-alanine ligase